MTQVTYQISPANLPRLLDKLAKLNRRAAKLNVSPLVLTQGDRIRHEYTETQEDGSPVTRVWYSIPCTLDGQAPKLEGWAFLASLEHTDDGNLIRAIPGVELPQAYRTAASVCDHCQTTRRRLATFVIRHDDGRTAQVGRNCLADFLGGVDPHSYAALVEMWGDLDAFAGALEGEGEGFGGRRAETAWALDSFLAYVCHAIEAKGWLSNGKARELADLGTPRQSTSGLVTGLLMQPVGEDRKAVRKYWDDNGPITEDHRAQAAAALAWAQDALVNADPAGLNDYQFNLRVITLADVVTLRTSGLAASLIIAYRKANDLLKARAERKPSQYVGTIGERGEFLVTLEKVITLQNDFGTTYLHIFRQDDNRITWFCKGSPVDMEGATMMISATVKAQEVYQGEQQTIVSRVTLARATEFVPGRRDYLTAEQRAASDAEAVKYAKRELKKAAKAAASGA